MWKAQPSISASSSAVKSPHSILEPSITAEPGPTTAQHLKLHSHTLKLKYPWPVAHLSSDVKTIKQSVAVGYETLVDAELRLNSLASGSSSYFPRQL